MVGSGGIRRLALGAAALVGVAFVAGALGQSSDSGTKNAASPPAKTQSQPASDQSNRKAHSDPAAPAAGKGSSGENAFPLAQSEAAARSDAQHAAPPDTIPPAPSATGESSRPKSADAEANPFPEAQSKAAARADRNSAPSPSGAQNGVPPGAGYSSSDAHLPPPDLGQGKGSLRHLDSYTRDHTLDGRIADDLNVADFYMKNGNYRGALLRYRDAIRYDPLNDTALYGEAEALCKQHQTSEAIAHFKAYVQKLPQGKHVLRAYKALAHPNECRHK